MDVAILVSRFKIEIIIATELLQLLKEIGAVTEKASFALAQRTESPLTAPVPGPLISVIFY